MDVKHHQPQGPAKFFQNPILPRLYPELKLCRNDIERLEARRAALNDRGQSLIFLVASVVAFVILRWTLAHTAAWIGLIPNSWRQTCDALLTTALFVGIVYAGRYCLREPARKRIRAYLRTRGFSLCENCGYDLRGLAETPDESGLCPECGALTASAPTPGDAAPARSGGPPPLPPR